MRTIVDLVHIIQLNHFKPLYFLNFKVSIFVQMTVVNSLTEFLVGNM